MKVALMCLAGAAFLLLFFYWCMRHVHFRIGSKHLKVMLFGVAIRKIELTDIANISKREPKRPAERWYSSLKTSHRLLVIERKSGWRKYFCITPQNRYVFLSDLKAAVRRVDPAAEWAALRAFEDTTHLFKGERSGGKAQQGEAPTGNGTSAAANA